jgi:hypothetical protein
LPDHVIIHSHQLDIIGAIPALRDNGGRLPERQTDLDVIYREPELQRVRNRDGVPAYKPIIFIVGSSIFPIFIATKYGTEKLEGVAFEIGLVSSSSSSSSSLKNKLPINS